MTRTISVYTICSTAAQRLLTDLQSELHFTNGPPVHLMAILKHAFDLSSPRFLEVLEDLSLNLLIYDILQPWAPATAAGLGIPSMVFITTSVVAFMYHFELNAPKDDVVTNAKEKEEDRVRQCVANSSNIILIKTFRGIEGKYANHLSLLTDKKIMLVGPLVAEPYCPDLKQNSIMFLKGEGEIDLSEALPSGFFKRVENRGLVVKGWGSQYKILGHKNIGRFHINDWLVVEVGVVLKVVRVKGLLTSHNVFEVVQQAVVGEEGQAVKKKAKKLRDSLKKRKMRRV
ncbi:hypothetical protein Tco_0393106 [Tanacetum coccineum]